MRGVTLAAVAFVAALLFTLPAAEAAGCHGGGGGAVFSFTAPQAFVAPVHQRQAFVAAPQRFVAQPVVQAVNVGHPRAAFRLNVGAAQPRVSFRRRIPPFNLLLGPRPVFR